MFFLLLCVCLDHLFGPICERVCNNSLYQGRRRSALANRLSPCPSRPKIPSLQKNTPTTYVQEQPFLSGVIFLGRYQEPLL